MILPPVTSYKDYGPGVLSATENLLGDVDDDPEVVRYRRDSTGFGETPMGLEDLEGTGVDMVGGEVIGIGGRGDRQEMDLEVQEDSSHPLQMGWLDGGRWKTTL